MRYIQKHPLDFQGQLLLETRKRWGMILLSLVTICCLVTVLLIYFKGLITVELLLISGFTPGLWLGHLWASVGSKIILLNNLKPLIELLWDNYSSYLMSILVLLVVMYRSESKPLGYHKKASH
jgi:hypothetical protein